MTIDDLFGISQGHAAFLDTYRMSIYIIYLGHSMSFAVLQEFIDYIYDESGENLGFLDEEVTNVSVDGISKTIYVYI